MKKLKYLLIAILFTAFAGEGFGQGTFSLSSSSGTISTFSQVVNGSTITGNKYFVSNCDIDKQFNLTSNYNNYSNCDLNTYPDPNDPNNGAIWIEKRVNKNQIILQKLTGNSWTTLNSQEDLSTVYPGSIGARSSCPSVGQITQAIPGTPTNYFETTGGTHGWSEVVSQTTVTYRMVFQKEHYLYWVNSGFDDCGFFDYVEYNIGTEYNCENVIYFQLEHQKKTLNVTSTLTENGTTHQPNGNSPSFDICGPTNINLENFNATCYDQWIVYKKEKVNGGSWSTFVNNGIQNSTLPSSINLSSMFGLTPGKKYKIVLKVGKNGQWTTPNSNKYTFDYKQSYTPTISGLSQICDGDNVTLQIQNYSGSPSGISWSSGQQNVDNITVSPNSTTLYNVTFTEACTQSPVAKTVIVNPLPTIDLSANDPDYCTNVIPLVSWNSTVTVSPTGGTGSWSSQTWTLQGSTFDPALNTIPGVGDITYTYTDLNGCTNSESYSMGYYDESSLSATVVDVDCKGNNNGEILPFVTGNPVSNYYLNNIATPLPYNNLSPGNYDVKVENVYGCFTSHSYSISEPSLSLTSSLSQNSPYHLACNGDNMSINFLNTAGGTAPYQYNFGSGYVGTAYGSVSGGSNQTFSVKDNNGCTESFSFDVIEPTALVTNSSPSPTTCWGINDGKILFATAGGTANYSYTVSNGVGTLGGNQANNLEGGTYSVTVTDNNGCNEYISGINVGNGSSNFTLNAVIDNDLCLGIGDGKITISPTGSFSPYSYSWTGGTNVLDNLLEGNYTVTVTGSNNCKVKGTYAVANDNTSRWHKTTQNTTGQNDNIKRILTDADGNVYALGEFTESTILDGNTISAGLVSGQKGVFLTKYDNCGNLKWYVHSDAQNSTFGIEGVDISFDNNGNIVMFAKLDNSQPNFFIKNSSGASVGINGVSGNFFSQAINQNSGNLGSVSYFGSILSTDSPVAAKIVGTDTYISGQFGGSAGVMKNNTLLFSESNANNNIIADIEIVGTTLFAIANITTSTSFGGTSVSSNGGLESIILSYNLSTNGYGTILAAHGDDITVKDLAIDNNDDVWVVGQFNGEIQGWSNLIATQTTALIMKFDNTLGVLGSYYINPQTSTITKSSANAIGSFIAGSSGSVDAIYVAGTFIGSNITLDGTGNMVQANGGSGLNKDLWLAEFSLPTTSGAGNINWINSSSSQDPVTVNAMAYDNTNTYVGGSYKSDIILPPSSVLSNPSPGPEFGYVIRGGDVFGQPAYYKTGNNNNSDSHDNFSNSIQSKSVQLGLYPNPNNGTFTLRYVAKTSGTVQMTIYDVTGRVLFSKQAHKESYEFKHQIVLSQYNKGVYVLQFEVNGITSYQKFVIE